MNTQLAAAVRIVTDTMTDLELSVMNNYIQLDMNPKGRIGYEKAKSLFTEFGGTRAHEEVKDIFAAIVNRRLG